MINMKLVPNADKYTFEEMVFHFPSFSNEAKILKPNKFFISIDENGMNAIIDSNIQRKIFPNRILVLHKYN